MIPYLLVFLLFQTPEKELKTAFLEEVNHLRISGCKCGNNYFKPVNEVVWDETLEKTAMLHSKDMYNKKYFSHISKNGKSPADRLKKQGYNYWSFAENIFSAIGYSPTPSEVVKAWKNSPGHCKNIMNPTVSEMAVGIYKGYYTQLFGSRQTK